LSSHDKPKAKFALCPGDEVRGVYAFCNQHDLWRK
jgi:superoxide reductase